VPSSGVFTFFVLFNGAAQAAAGAYLQTSVVAVASLFGPPAVQAMMSGQAAVAVAVSGVQVLSAAASVHGRPSTYVSDGSAEERSAFIFFLLSTIFLIFSAMVYSWLVRTPVYARVAAPLEQQSRKISNEVVNSSEQIGLVSSRPTGLSDENANAAIRVAKANVTYEVAVAYVFVVTLVSLTLPMFIMIFLNVVLQAVYPAITTSIQSTNPDIHPLLFSSTHFLVFNIGDFLGRYTCSYPIFLIWSAKHLLTLSVARTLFIPVFLMCNVQRPSIVPSSPVISSDFFYMAILFAFGWSNGYVSSLCMMSAPSLEHNPRLKGRVEDVDTAATVASFCLVGGLALGSIASFAVRAAICNCNPFTTS
jgi:equilibrative nucleoside transporter 1/2/3